MFGSPQPANRKQTFTQCAFGVTYGVEGVTVKDGVHYYSGLDDARNGGVNTNGFYSAQTLWDFFSSSVSPAGAPSTPSARPKLSLARAVRTGSKRAVQIGVVAGGGATVQVTLRKGARLVVAHTFRVTSSGATKLALLVPARTSAGAYTVKVSIRTTGGTFSFARTVRVPK